MLIGVSGKIGVGKDTVGTIIQGLDSAKTAGKKNPNMEWILKYHVNTTWHIKKFATKVKEVAGLLLNLPVAEFEDRSFKSMTLREVTGEDHWTTYIIIPSKGSTSPPLVSADKEFIEKRKDTYGLHLGEGGILNHNQGMVEKDMTIREFLQRIGTDCMRNNLHPNAWVSALFAEYKIDMDKFADASYSRGLSKTREEAKSKAFVNLTELKDMSNTLPKWIVTDVRFINEAKGIKKRGGLLIRVNREVKQNTKIANHPSETSLDDYKDWDYIIDNNGTLSNLIDIVKEILIKEELYGS